jgi:hypothetical protein
MAYDEKLATRIRKALVAYKGVDEIKMFGGLCFTIRGNMCCGVSGKSKDNLILRVAPEAAAKYLSEPHVRPMDFTGRPMKNFLYIGPKGYKTASSLRKWIKRAVDFASHLPPKA